MFIYATVPSLIPESRELDINGLYGGKRAIVWVGHIRCDGLIFFRRQSPWLMPRHVAIVHVHAFLKRAALLEFVLSDEATFGGENGVFNDGMHNGFVPCQSRSCRPCRPCRFDIREGHV